MKKIDIVFFALLVFGLLTMLRAEFGDVTGNVVNACVDSDGGINPGVGGNLVGYDGTSKRDFCINSTTLNEYFCLEDRSNGLIDETHCSFGCVEEKSKGKCLERGELTKGESKFGSCNDGCYFKGVCLDVGLRTNDGTYCDITEDLEVQLFDGDSCVNNFECRSNLCVAGNCVSKKVFDKFLESLS
ncbi:MAG: hypothetical protein CMH62_03000 [Nanoarchaeota archaeon]|nr:hypothetical protein [Nanoarchaeota archaeon]